MDPSLISILMPVRNATPFLAECLDSILNQEERHWELLAVNDHSTDHSADILQAYAARDPRIQALSANGRGITPALRQAFGAARGTLITRMDADDRMLPGKLHHLKSILLEHGPGIIATGKVRYFSGATLGDGYQRYAEWLNGLCVENNHWRDRYRECVIPSPNWMMWRSDLENAGDFRPDTYPEDYDLCFRCYADGLEVRASPEILHEWRDHPTRASRTDDHYLDHRFLALKVAYFLLLDHNPARPLVLWGAGKKGRQVAGMLAERRVPFSWICNTPSKWGHRNHGTEMQPVEALDALHRPLLILAVAEPAGRAAIEATLLERALVLGKDAFFFC